MTGRPKTLAAASVTASRSSSGAMPVEVGDGGVGAEDAGDLGEGDELAELGCPADLASGLAGGEVAGDRDGLRLDLQGAGEVVVGGDLDLDAEPGGQGLGQDRAVDAGVVPADQVEPVGGLDRLAFVGLDGDLAAAVHRGVGDGEDLGGDEGGVVDEQGPAFGHGPDQRPVDELVGAVGALGVLADEVGDRGVAVAGHGDQVGEGGLDQGRLAGTGRAVQQGGDARRAQGAQRRHVRHVGQYAGPVDLPVRAGHRRAARRRGRGEAGRRGAGEAGAGGAAVRGRAGAAGAALTALAVAGVAR